MVKIIKSEPDPLIFLKEFTSARIAIGSAGSSIPTQQLLEFKLAHAHARDAVYAVMDNDALEADLLQFDLPVVHLQSQAQNRNQYLQRPDLGRLLHGLSATRLSGHITGSDVLILIADGLSAVAMHENVLALLHLLLPRLAQAKLTIGPICLIQQGRVAIGDPIAHTLGTKLSVMLIGERPGLSAADSMGAYLTYNPRPGLKDNARNCVSNIRPGGLSYQAAADKIYYLIHEAFRRKLSGVALKDNSGLLSE